MKKIPFRSCCRICFGLFRQCYGQFCGRSGLSGGCKTSQSRKPGRIEVREFFWYGCGHCFALEPHMQGWLKKLPKDVRFVRTPAAMNPLWEQAARAYYVSEALGVRQKHIYNYSMIFMISNVNFRTGAIGQVLYPLWYS